VVDEILNGAMRLYWRASKKKSEREWPMRSLASTMMVVSVLAMPVVSHAYVACDVTPTGVMSGDDGNFYIYLSNGGLAYINKNNDPGDFNTTVALATSAVLTEKNLVIRFVDGTACNAMFGVIVGLQMNR
jgi:hypothetical protein